MNPQNPERLATVCHMRIRVIILALLLPVLLPASRASTLEAIPSYELLGADVIAYAKGGAGFAFSPQTNLVVLSLGFGGSSLTNEPYRVCLWDTNGVQLACTMITTTSPLRNFTRYELILPLPLEAGQKFYISAVGANTGRWEGEAVNSSGPNPNGTFSVAPDIAYLGFAASTNSAGVFPLAEGVNSGLMIGANFEYVPGPLIILSGVALSGGQAHVGLNLTGTAPSSLILLEAEQPGGPWFTNANAVLITNMEGARYSFASPLQGQARFFRVLAP